MDINDWVSRVSAVLGVGGVAFGLWKGLKTERRDERSSNREDKKNDTDESQTIINSYKDLLAEVKSERQEMKDNCAALDLKIKELQSQINQLINDNEQCKENDRQVRRILKERGVEI